MQPASYLIKCALGDILQAQMTRPLTQSPVPDVWDADKQKTIDELVGMLPPSPRRVPVRSGLARMTAIAKG